MKNPSPGSCFGGFGRPGDATVETGAALTTTMRRTDVARIAATMARVPREAMPASEFEWGPRPESTASLPAIADHRGDVVTGSDGLFKKLSADSPGRCDDREFQVPSPFEVGPSNSQGGTY